MDTIEVDRRNKNKKNLKDETKKHLSMCVVDVNVVCELLMGNRHDSRIEKLKNQKREKER